MKSHYSKKNFSFMITCRLNSSRIPNKALKNINGKPLIEHQIERLLKCDLPIIICTTTKDIRKLQYLKNKYKVKFYVGHDEDPLKRVHLASEEFGVDYAIRITTDKIFILKSDIDRAIKEVRIKRPDYFYLTGNGEGNRFEIIKRSALKKASERFTDIEHISYAIKAVSKNTISLDSDRKQNHRLLIDYPEDLSLMEIVFSQLGNNCELSEVDLFLNANRNLLKINDLPKITVYTCAKNSAIFIKDAMKSVKEQTLDNIEYILIDDFSVDKTFLYMNEFCLENNFAKCYRNEKNLGLSSSSNKALKLARSPYIVRLDSDDQFTNKESLEKLYNTINDVNKDVVYPDNYLGSYKKIQKGNENHHIGGAIFKTAALNHIKFTENLTKGDSGDIYKRARNILNIGYLKEPIFFYTQREDSLSRS